MITRVASDLAIRVLAAARNALLLLLLLLLLLVAPALTSVSAGRGVDVPDGGGRLPVVGLFVSPAPPGPARQHPEQARQAVLREERARLSLRWQGRSGARRTPR